MRRNFIFLLVSILIISCKRDKISVKDKSLLQGREDVYIVVLGVAQDGGFPHINNSKEFEAVKEGRVPKELVTSLGVVDKKNNKKIIDLSVL